MFFTCIYFCIHISCRKRGHSKIFWDFNVTKGQGLRCLCWMWSGYCRRCLEAVSCNAACVASNTGPRIGTLFGNRSIDGWAFHFSFVVHYDPSIVFEYRTVPYLLLMGFLCLMITAGMTFFRNSGFPFLTVATIMSPRPAASNLFSLPLIPLTAMMYRSFPHVQCVPIKRKPVLSVRYLHCHARLKHTICFIIKSISSSFIWYQTHISMHEWKGTI